MDALLPAFVAALLAECGDRTPWLVAILAARYRSGWVLAGVAVAAAACSAIAAGAGAYVGPMLTPNARALLLGCALLAAAVGGIGRLKEPDRLDRWQLGGFLTSALGFFILEFGERSQFLVFALAVHSATPVLAGVGGWAGVMVASGFAAVLGEQARRHLPIRAMRLAPAALFLVTGLVTALSALRLT